MIRSLRHAAPALLGALLTAAGVTAGGGAPAMGAASPGSPRVVSPGTASSLNGTFCTSKTSCWAVGSFLSSTGASLNQVLRWNGSKWSQVSVPSAGGTTDGHRSELHAVRCRAANDCWSVGDSAKNSGITHDQALHWNGSKWSLVPTPTTAGGVLSDVVCTSGNNCWAAGRSGAGDHDPGAPTLNQILHWNGTAWSPVTTIPQPAGTAPVDIQELASVRCTSASSCLAVGTSGTKGFTSILQNQTLRWNGTKWSTQPTPNPAGTASGDFSMLSGLACTAATDCWAAGNFGSNATVRTSLNQLLHWDGNAWTQDDGAPNPGGTAPGSNNELFGATCTSATDCWAVGDQGAIVNGTGAVDNQALHWDGSTWSAVTTPDPTGTLRVDTLNSVRCTTPASCWAVGVASGHNEALQWNGTMWTAK